MLTGYAQDELAAAAKAVLQRVTPFLLALQYFSDCMVM
jgi:hypothetical protein